jgi:hypothetical protein
LLDAMRRLVAAQLKEYNAIEEYNSDLARYEWGKGNSMKHNNVVIADGNIPVCAEVSAVKHERERSQAIVLRERSEHDAIRTPGLMAGSNDMPDHLATPPGSPNGSLPQAPTLVDPTPQSENPPDAPTGPLPQVVPPAGTPALPSAPKAPAVPMGPMFPTGPMGPTTAAPANLGNGVTVLSSPNGPPNGMPAFRSMSSTSAAPSSSATSAYSSPYPVTPIPTTTSSTSVYAPSQTATPTLPAAPPGSPPASIYAPNQTTPQAPISTPSAGPSVYAPSAGSTLR